jgi:hypothetical protein
MPQADSTFDPTTNPDVQEALSRRYGNAGLYILPLRSGTVAIFKRDMSLHDIIDPGELAEFDYLLELSRDFDVELTQRAKHASAARFYGEPGDRDLARDLKRERTPPRVPRETNRLNLDLAIDI